MENLDLIKQQQKIVSDLQERQEELRKKFDTKGFVVAGFGGDTYYTFIGTGRGFNGAALAPLHRRPVIFDTKEAAAREANNGTYRNGYNEIIRLKVVEASTYFRRVHAEIEKSIAFIKEQFSK